MNGKRSGNLTIIDFHHKTNAHSYWRCICDCGRETVVRKDCLSTARTKSCGCLKSSVAKKNIGEKINRLTIIGLAKTKTGHNGFEALCECGSITIASRSDLKSGHTKSCGCYAKEVKGDGTRTHGKAKTRLHGIRNGMTQRCYNPNRKAYKDYGGRGIKVCGEWRSDYVVFENWALGNGYRESLCIERIDNDGNYEPSNCRWATPKEQANNRRHSPRQRVININGQPHFLSDLAKENGLKPDIVSARFRRGWKMPELLAPLMGQKT